MIHTIKPWDDGKRKAVTLEEAMKEITAYQPKTTKPTGTGNNPAKPPKKQKPAQIPKPATAAGVAYSGILFEPKALYKGSDKELLTYDQSLARLKKAGYKRHARPQEAFGLIVDGLEGKLTSQLKDVYDDMFNSYGEWLSMAIERKGDLLVAYLDPEGLVYRGDKYVKTKKFKYSSKAEFDITGKNSVEWIALSEFSDEFVKHFYGRQFNGLPKKMQKGDRRAQVYLPADKAVWPVGRVNFNNRFYINNYYGASRGVR